MFLLVHISSFTNNDRCESKIIGLFNTDNELTKILEQFRQDEIYRCNYEDGDEDYTCMMVQVTMNLESLFDDYHVDKWVVYKINPSNPFFQIEGLKPYRVYMLK